MMRNLERNGRIICMT
uniref:Uncharacterized protein n=1 Tax=Arundo donax TaxID=35708 RepID=A0A0A9G789_ARUDO